MVDKVALQISKQAITGRDLAQQFAEGKASYQEMLRAFDSLEYLFESILGSSQLLILNHEVDESA